MVRGPPENTDDLDHDELKAEGQKQRIVDITAIKRTDHGFFNYEAITANDQGGDDQGQPEVPGDRHGRQSGIGPPHEHGPMGEIDHGQKAEDNGKSQGQQHIKHAQGEPGEKLHDDSGPLIRHSP
jgi:hypothetical protein